MSASTTKSSMSSHPCFSCGLMFAKRADFDHHENVFHNRSDRLALFICDQCGKSFDQSTDMAEHQMEHDLASLLKALYDQECGVIDVLPQPRMQTAAQPQLKRQSMSSKLYDQFQAENFLPFRTPLLQNTLSTSTNSENVVVAAQDQDVDMEKTTIEKEAEEETVRSQSSSDKTVITTTSSTISFASSADRQMLKQEASFDKVEPTLPLVSSQPNNDYFSSEPTNVPDPNNNCSTSQLDNVQSIKPISDESKPPLPADLVTNAGHQQTESLTGESSPVVSMTPTNDPKPTTTVNTNAPQILSSVCPNCGGMYGKPWLLIEHMINEHRALLVGLQRKVTSGDSSVVLSAMSEEFADVSCTYCGMYSDDSTLNMGHILRTHRDKLFECPEMGQCDACFEILSSLGQEDVSKRKFTIRVKIKRKPKT